MTTLCCLAWRKHKRITRRRIKTTSMRSMPNLKVFVLKILISSLLISVSKIEVTVQDPTRSRKIKQVRIGLVCNIVGWLYSPIEENSSIGSCKDRGNAQEMEDNVWIFDKDMRYHTKEEKYKLGWSSSRWLPALFSSQPRLIGRKTL